MVVNYTAHVEPLSLYHRKFRPLLITKVITSCTNHACKMQERPTEVSLDLVAENCDIMKFRCRVPPGKSEKTEPDSLPGNRICGSALAPPLRGIHLNLRDSKQDKMRVKAGLCSGYETCIDSD